MPGSKQISQIALLAIIVVLGLAAHLRITAVAKTTNYGPLVGDSLVYLSYADNLANFGIFSRTRPTSATEPPPPDAFVAPGYPTLLSQLMDQQDLDATILRVGYFQAALGIATVWIYWLLFRRFLRPAFATTAALLVAISPHLINATTYLLTETLFTFSLGLLLLSLSTALQSGRILMFALAGLILGLTTLIRPTTLLFLAPLLLIFPLALRNRRWVAGFLTVAAVFVVIQGSWAVRNTLATGRASDPSLSASFIQHGMYIGLKYQDRPETFGYPYKYDPENSQIAGHMDRVLAALKERVTEMPGRYTYWFLIGKPIQYLSWNLTESVGDSFIYTPLKTPYADQAVFRGTHYLSYLTHTPIICLALLGCLLAFVPRWRTANSMLLSIALLYFIGFHMIGAPFPRYSLPVRPLLYGLALLCIQIGWDYFLALRKSRSGTAPPIPIQSGSPRAQ